MQFGNTAPLSSLFESQNVGVDTTLTSGGEGEAVLAGTVKLGDSQRQQSGCRPIPELRRNVRTLERLLPGNATPLQIFNANGSFKGTTTIQIFGSGIWDSDTEVQSTTTALTFIENQVPGSGTQITNGAITSLFSEPGAPAFLQSIDGLTTVAGYTISHIPTSTDLIATITISSVPEPASMVMLGMGVIGMVVVGRSMKQ